MKSHLSNHRYRTFLAVLVLMANVPGVHASGSYGAGGGQGNQEYNLGKSAFYKKLVCSGCPLADQDIDAGKAADIVKMLTDNASAVAQKLSESEREAVTAYLNRRYKLN